MDKAFALIIDDNAENATVLTNLLLRQNIISTQILHPYQLESVLENIGHIDVVFLDLEMPGSNGYDILETLRADKRFQDIPIVACTVHVSEKSATYQHGFHSFLGKPLDAGKFPHQITRILNGEQVWE